MVSVSFRSAGEQFCKQKAAAKAAVTLRFGALCSEAVLRSEYGAVGRCDSVLGWAAGPWRGLFL